MRSKWYLLFAFLVMASMLLAACQPATVVQTVVVTEIVAGTAVERVITATPEPATAVPPAAEVPVAASKDPENWVQASFGEPETLDPALDYESAGGEILTYVYDTLIFYNKDSAVDFVPNLATEVPTLENGGISEDGLTYVFNIRDGVKFHDGSDMTVEDVAFTFQRGILQGGLSSPQWLFTEALFGSGIDDVSLLVADDGSLYDDPAALAAADPEKLVAACETVKSAIVADADAKTVTFKLANPWGAFLAAFPGSWGSVMSQAWVAANGGWDGDCATWQNFYGVTSETSTGTVIGSAPMGTGMYKFDHWTPGEEIVLTANENYWRTEPMWEGGPSGVPASKTWVNKNVEEFSTRLSMLQAGDADYIDINADQWPIADELVGEICDYQTGACEPTADPSQPLRMYRNFTTGNRTDLFFNFNINTEGNNFIGSGKLDGNGIPADFFGDIHIRKAFAYCFDYETYLTDALQGEAVRSKTLMLPGMIGYDDAQPVYEYDPAKCEEEFKASTITGEGGATVWDTGFRVTMAYNTGNTVRQTIAQILQQNVAAVNDKFVVEVTGLPWAAFLQAQRAKQLPLFTVGWIMDLYDSHNWVVPYTTGTYGNRQSLSPELQAQFREIYGRAVTTVKPEDRAEIYKEFNKLYYDEVPGLILYQTNGRRYLPKYVEGFYYNPILSGMVDNFVYAMTEK